MLSYKSDVGQRSLDITTKSDFYLGFKSKSQAKKKNKNKWWSNGKNFCTALLRSLSKIESTL